MFNNLLGKISLVVLTIMGLWTPAPVQNLGTQTPQTPALVDTYLAANIDATQTSMELANGLYRNGQSLSGYMCFTLDANTPTVE